MDSKMVEPGVWSVIRDGVVYEARVDGDVVTVRGRRYVMERRDARAWNPAGRGGMAQGRVTVKSPMPGKVVRVMVGVGNEVAAGQGVVVIEAMKMQNELKSAKAGRVVTVGVKEFDTVEAGTVLVVIE